MPGNQDFDLVLKVTVDGDHIEDVLRAAAATGDHDFPNTLKNALTVLINDADHDAFQYLAEWEAHPVGGRDTSLKDLALAKLDEFGLNASQFENAYDEADDPAFPHDRYFAVERIDDKTWVFAGATAKELADVLNDNEVQAERLVFVTDLLTGVDYVPGITLTAI